MASNSAKRLRCAIYTRKSTEEGLEQAFNSLDAQREACAAYILSQRHEGWTLHPDLYDDGGFIHWRGLTIKSVSLLEDGNELATDAHSGFAARNRDYRSRSVALRLLGVRYGLLAALLFHGREGGFSKLLA